MKACSKPTEKRERSVFFTIFISVLVILAVEVTLLIGSIACHSSWTGMRRIF